MENRGADWCEREGVEEEDWFIMGVTAMEITLRTRRIATKSFDFSGPR